MIKDANPSECFLLLLLSLGRESSRRAFTKIFTKNVRVKIVKLFPYLKKASMERYERSCDKEPFFERMIGKTEMTQILQQNWASRLFRLGS